MTDISIEVLVERVEGMRSEIADMKNESRAGFRDIKATLTSNQFIGRAEYVADLKARETRIQSLESFVDWLKRGVIGLVGSAIFGALIYGSGKIR